MESLLILQQENTKYFNKERFIKIEQVVSDIIVIKGLIPNWVMNGSLDTTFGNIRMVT